MFSVFLFTKFYLPICKNKHWHLLVVNLATQRVKVLSSISLTRGKRPSSNSIKLSAAITKAFHAFLMHHNLDIGAFTHVYPDVFGKKKMGKNIVRYILHCLIGNCNCLSSLCFNQFHPIFV